MRLQLLFLRHLFGGQGGSVGWRVVLAERAPCLVLVFAGPAAVGFNRLVHLQHQLLRGLQCGIDAQPVREVILAQATGRRAPVVQPLVEHLVAANGVLPDRLVHVGKTAGGIDEHLAHLVIGARDVGQCA